MFLSHVRTILATILLLAFSASISRTQTPAGSADADSTAVKKTVAGYTDAFNRHDAHGIAIQFADDADSTTTLGATVHGSKKIEAHFAGIFGKGFKAAHRSDSVRGVRFLSSSVASVDVDWILTGTKTPDGVENPVRKGLVNYVLVKRNGEWLIAISHEIEIPSSPSK